MAQGGRIIALTGVTGGLGRALVDRFAEADHTVCGCGRTEEALAELRQRYPHPHLFHRVDVADGRAVEAWAAEVLAAVGAPDLVINNAALINGNARLWQVPEEEFTALLQVNIGGVANVVRAFVPAMIAAGRGVVANISSGWGRSTAPEVAPYCATKWAVEGLSQALAQELPEGLTAVAVNPGIIDTPMLRSTWGEGAGQFPDAEEWSRRAAPFFLELNRRSNGQALTVK